MRKLLILLIPVLLLSGGVKAQKDGLTTLAHYRSATYRLLGLDTAGPAHLGVDVMTQFVYRGVDQVPAGVLGKEVSKQGLVTGAVNVLYIDSLVSVVKEITMIDSGIIRPLKQRPPDYTFEEYSNGGMDQEFLEFSYFADTAHFYPNRLGTGQDTFRIEYYQQPNFAADTTIVLERDFQMGVVFYAQYLSEMRLQRGRVAEAKKYYDDWLAFARETLVKRKKDLYPGEAK